jgi:hypothetical protein
MSSIHIAPSDQGGTSPHVCSTSMHGLHTHMCTGIEARILDPALYTMAMMSQIDSG